MKKYTIVVLILLPLLSACQQKTVTSQTSSEFSTTSSSPVATESSEETTKPKASSEQTFSELADIIGTWVNEEKERSFSITGREIISEDKNYQITGIDVTQNEDSTQYVLSWDPDLFIETYGKPESFNPQPFIYDYDQNKDTLSNSISFKRFSDKDQISYLKDQLAGKEPINLEQLLQVDNPHLLAFWTKATNESEESADQLKSVYDDIAIDYPDLNLLTDQDYETYLSIAKEITDHSDYSFSDLNTALPRDVFDWYTELSQITDESNWLEQLLPKIATAREEYFKREEKSDVPYLDKSSNENLDEEMKQHIREKIKNEFPNELPENHIVYEMTQENNAVLIKIYENSEAKKQYEGSFSYDIDEDKLSKNDE